VPSPSGGALGSTWTTDRLPSGTVRNLPRSSHMGPRLPAVHPPVQPMAAKTVDHLPTEPGWSFEPKFDGFRALAFQCPKGVMLQSRQLRSLTAAFPEVAASVRRLEGVVLDGELVVWRAGRFDFAALQDRLHSGSARVRRLVAASPAAYIVFDALAINGKDLRDRPYRKRRRKLERLLNQDPSNGLLVTPATDDAGVARKWMFAHGASGIEGVVAKRQDQSYRPGRPGWRKLRTRVTAEAVVGGVTGPVDAPGELILGRFKNGRFRLAGRTTTLHPAASTELGTLLRPTAAHPWPEVLPPYRFGGAPTAYTRVAPELVVELSTDFALEGQRWRHPVRFMRYRADLCAADLPG
jgi:ATP-dependent DNA ligase